MKLARFQLSTAAFLCLASIGCVPRIKSWESFESATTPNPPAPKAQNQAADPYSSAGFADASGGLNPTTSYGEGARMTGTGPLDPTADQAAKGTGQQGGEYNGEAAPGYGRSNGPAMQPMPSSASTSSTTSVHSQ